MEYKERPGYWDEWKYVEYLTLDQAAMMLSGIDPELANDTSTLRAKKPMLEAVRQSVIIGGLKPFRLYEWTENGYDRWLVPVEEIGSGTEIAKESTVLVTDVAAWADARGIPHGFDTFTALADSKTKTASDAELKYLRAEVESLKARAETAEKQLAEIEASPFSARERNNMLRIVRALSEMAGLQASSGIASIERQLQELGFTRPKEQTIRKVLKGARELEPDENPN